MARASSTVAGMMGFVSAIYACDVGGQGKRATGGTGRNTNGIAARRRRRPYGYWTSNGRLSGELQEFAKAQGEETRMPTLAELMAAGRSDIAGAIRRQGSWGQAANAAGLTLTSIVRPRSLYLSFCTNIRGARPHGYWRDFANVRRELSIFVAQKGVLPTAGELMAANRSDLIRAVRMHGGFESVAKHMQLRIRYRSAKYWRDFANVEKELLEFIDEYGVDGVMPPVALFRKFAMPGLLPAIEQTYGGMTVVARRVGLECMHPRRPHGYWKSREHRVEELQAFVELLRAEQPNRDHSRMPSYVDMLRWGRADLAAALCRYEGFGTAAKLVGLRAYGVKDEICAE